MTRIESAVFGCDAEARCERPGGAPAPAEAWASGQASPGRPGLWLQPQVALSGEIAGYEATRRTACGASPNQVPQTREDLFSMLRRCCAEAAMWRGDSHRFLDISTAALAVPDLAPGLREILRDSALESCRLGLLVDAGALTELERAMSQLRRIKALGVKLVLSGFGARALHPGALRSELFDGVRLDPALYAGVKRGSRPHDVLCAMVELGRRLAGDVLADGVASRAQLAMLRETGCTLFQGALLGAPMPAQDFA